MAGSLPNSVYLTSMKTLCGFGGNSTNDGRVSFLNYSYYLCILIRDGLFTLPSQVFIGLLRLLSFSVG